MAKARMLHKKISLSMQVNDLSLPAQLLFTWMISHADDDGKLRGEPEYVKATVVPMKKWSFSLIKKYIEEIKSNKLIYYWNKNDEWFIQFIKWNEHQSIKSDRYKQSDLPSFEGGGGDPQSPDEIQTDSKVDTQSSVIESSNKVNPVEVNSSESKGSEIADKNSYKQETKISIPDLKNMKSPSQVAAYEVWKEFEPDNLRAFYTTYLLVAFKGVPAEIIYQFASEMRQDKTIKNPGAVFNNKAENYLKNKKFGNHPDPLIDNPTKEVEDEVNEHED